MLKNKFVYLVLICLVFAGCGRYGFVNLNYPQEPLIYLPDNVKSIAVVNRSLTREEDKKSKVIESVTTGEIAGSDRLASDDCLKGVYDGIHGVGGFIILFPKKSRMYGTGTRETPDLLDWDRVEEICDSTDADVLLVLETFDSNTDLLLSTAAEQVTSILATGTPKPGLPNQIRMNILCYWRMYDPASRTIIDQFQQKFYMMFDTEGRLPPPDALPQTAYAAGQEYVRRFLPSYYTVRRDLYKRAKGSARRQFKTGFRRAEVANWDGAIEIWSKLAEHAKRKVAGRACLDIAVAYEVLGNTDLALEWAKKSYEDYNDKLGRDYAKILLRRKSLEY